MQQLSSLVQQRIQHCQNLSATIRNCLAQATPIANLDHQFLVNRAVMRILAKSKRQEKERTDLQSRFLSEIKPLKFTTTATIQDFHEGLMAILAEYHPHYAQTPHPSPRVVQSPSSRLRRLLWLLIGEDHFPDWLRTDAMNVIGGDMMKNTTPWMLLGWVCEWSRLLFASTLQQHTSTELTRHEQEMNKISRNPAKGLYSGTVSSQRASEIPIVALSNKQSVYGLFIEQLHAYYKQIFPWMEIDMSFPKSMRKLTSKGNEFEREENINKAAEILLESKNKQIRDITEQFQKQWRDYAESKGIRQASNSTKPRSYHSYFLRKKAAQQKINSNEHLPGSPKQQIKAQKPQQSFLLGGYGYQKQHNSTHQTPKELLVEASRSKLRERKELELPEITPHANFAKVTTPFRPVYLTSLSNSNSQSLSDQPSFQGFKNSSFVVGKVGDCQEEELIIAENTQSKFITPKNFKIKEFYSLPSLELQLKKKVLKLMPATNPEEHRRELARSTEAPSLPADRNRKIMLQLLGEKNKRLLVQ